MVDIFQLKTQRNSQPGSATAQQQQHAAGSASGGGGAVGAAPPPSLTSMLGGNGTPSATGNTPQSLEQLLERQWEQGSQFLMEQAQHFDSIKQMIFLHFPKNKLHKFAIFRSCIVAVVFTSVAYRKCTTRRSCYQFGGTS